MASLAPFWLEQKRTGQATRAKVLAAMAGGAACGAREIASAASVRLQWVYRALDDLRISGLVESEGGRYRRV